MSVINTQPLIGSSGNQGTGYNLERSLRFRSGASAYLNRTFGTPTDALKFTWSGWVKRGTLSGASSFAIASDNNSSSLSVLSFANDQILWQIGNGTNGYGITTTQVFRDPSAWYHVVAVADTANATSSNRLLLYINGVQVTSFASTSYPTQNFSSGFNSSGSAKNIGRVASGSQYFDGYLTEVNFIDGQALTPTSFGENDTITGVWKPKRFSGTYGTNGFYLKFTDIATTSGSNAGLGKDFSGNSNYWNTNNISVTAGTTYDSMTDVPTLTSATAANYSVMNPLSNSGNWTMTDGNLKATNGTGGSSAYSTIYPTSGKFYVEYVVTNRAGDFFVGLFNSTASAVFTAYRYTGERYNGSAWVSYGATYTTGDVISMAFDITGGTIEFYKNGTSQGSVSITYPSAPVASTVYSGTSGTVTTANFGQQPWTYSLPSGFKALNTYNLPDSTIKAGNKYMDATTYTGTGANATITNAGVFKPDFVWVKKRSGAENHALYDSVRGVNQRLVSNSTGAESTVAGVSAFNSNGFDINVNYSTSSATYIGWQWQGGAGTSASNTSGSITSTVSANASAGFSVVTYSGNGSNATIGHGLGVAPRFVIVKNRTLTDDWCVYHASSGAANYSQLNLNSAFGANSTIWNNTAPTSSVFSVGTYLSKSGSNYVAYCWSEIEGFSKFGSYAGNGSADGAFIYTGFRPKFVIIKRSDAVNDWVLRDTSRSLTNVSSEVLYTDYDNAEGSGGSGHYLDFLSNGIKIRNSADVYNLSGGTYIYMAFAENPFKNSLAR